MRVNQNGSALNNWTLYQIRDEESNSSWFVPVGKFLVEPIENNPLHSKIALKLDPMQEITWADGGKGMNEIPKDMPECGFKGELCITRIVKGNNKSRLARCAFVKGELCITKTAKGNNKSRLDKCAFVKGELSTP